MDAPPKDSIDPIPLQSLQISDVDSVDHPQRQYGNISMSGSGLTVNGDIINYNLPGHTPNKTEEFEKFGLCLGSAPQIQPDYFIGRGVELDEMHRNLQPGTPMKQQRVTLGGMGGIGKTQLALAYTERYQKCYDSIFWLNATSLSTLQASLRLVAGRFLKPNEQEALDDEQVLSRVHEWLSRMNNTKWLLVFDNYDEPELFDISKYCPYTAHGSLIVTTRLPDLLRISSHHIQMRPLHDIQDGLRILETRSKRENVRNNPDAYRLAQRLGGLPLALASAGAFLNKSVSVSFQQYLHAYEQRWNIDPRRAPRLQEYQDRTLYTTWNISYARLQKEDPEAANFLKLLAYFDNQEVWFELLATATDGDVPDWLERSLADKISFESVMGILAEYCFIEVQSGTRSYSVHSCVHDWTLGELNRVLDPQLYWYAFTCVSGSLDQPIHLEKRQYARFTRHGVRLTHDRITANIELASISSDHLDIMNSVATLLSMQGQFTAAEKLFKKVLSFKQAKLGPEHISTLSTLNSLGNMYLNVESLDEAEKILLQAMAGYEKSGFDSSSSLAPMNNLGQLYYTLGKLDEAEQMFLRVLQYENVFENSEINDGIAMTRLGLVYADQGKLHKAEEMQLRALAKFKTTVGLEYSRALAILRELGSLYWTQGKLDEAEQMYQQALAGYEKTYGLDGFNALGTLIDLGRMYTHRGKLTEAQRLYDDLLRTGKNQLFANLRYAVVLSRNIQTNSADKFNLLRQLISMVKRYWKADILFTMELARAMVSSGDEKNAQLAYQHSVRLIDQKRADYCGVTCDGCSRLILVPMGLNVCKECVELDFCDECMAKYAGNKMKLPMCSGHAFFHVDTQMVLAALEESQNSAAHSDSWIDGIMAEYASEGADDNTIASLANV